MDFIYRWVRAIQCIGTYKSIALTYRYIFEDMDLLKKKKKNIEAIAGVLACLNPFPHNDTF